MERADWALVISVTSASLSLGALVWQLVLYRLSGARLDVRLIPALVDSTGLIVQGPQSGWTPDRPLGEGSAPGWWSSHTPT